MEIARAGGVGVRYRTIGIVVAVAVAMGLLGVAASSAIRVHDRNAECVDVAPTTPLLRSRAEQGDASAENELGVSYECGKGVRRDEGLALKWYGRAADHGLGVAQNNMGRLYARGQGVRRDYVEAMKWFQRAAAQGDAAAMNNVGHIYGEGLGVPQDRIEALKWMYLAFARYSAQHIQEPDYATHNRGLLAATMSKSDMAEAQRRAEMVAFDDSKPPWMGSDQYALLSKLGVDPAKDLEQKGHYHWKWRTTRKLVIAPYSCPPGSAVDISRTLILLTAPRNMPCENAQGRPFEYLKLHPDGSAEPFPE